VVSEAPSSKTILLPNKTDSALVTSSLHTLGSGLQYTAVQTDTIRNGMVMPSAPDKTVYTNKVLDNSTYWKFVALIFIQIIFVTMVYGPIAAFLVELFPTKIRYTSMSLPYHIGNGVFGGLTPFIATLLTTMHTGDALVGLWYPIFVAAVCLVIGLLYVSNRIDPNVND
jgi:MFS family permease